MYVYVCGDPTAIPAICFNMRNYWKVGLITGEVIALCGVSSIPGPTWIHPFVLPMALAPTRDNWWNFGHISKTTCLVHLQTIQNGYYKSLLQYIYNKQYLLAYLKFHFTFSTQKCSFLYIYLTYEYIFFSRLSTPVLFCYYNDHCSVIWLAYPNQHRLCLYISVCKLQNTGRNKRYH